MKFLRRAVNALVILVLTGYFTSFVYAQNATTETTVIGNAGQLQFNLTYNSDIDQMALHGFEEAAGRWANIFNDPIVVNLQIGFDNLSPGIIGQTSSSELSYSYTSVRNALVLDSTSLTDATAVTYLQPGPSLQFLVNYTAQNGDTATPYLDNNGNFDNLNIGMTTANAKALGLLGASSQEDASIVFTSNSATIPFDFNPDDGITAGEYDFVGAATHEIGHALGFISTADDVSYGSPGSGGTPVDESSFDPDTLDLFRYSTESTAQGGFDITADSRTKYFSLDGGATQVSSNSLFSDGIFNGDGQQASHWKDNIGAGIMDPTAAPGELLQISGNDIRLFDAIGYNVVTAPEPSPVFVLALGTMGLLGCTIIRRRHSPC